MLRLETHGDHYIAHTLEHLSIGESPVQALVTENRYAAQQPAFFAALRDGHRAALSAYDQSLEAVIGPEETADLAHYGPFGKFSGKIAVSESGLAVVERLFHHQHPGPELTTALQASVRSATQWLRS